MDADFFDVFDHLINTDSSFSDFLETCLKICGKDHSSTNLVQCVKHAPNKNLKFTSILINYSNLN